MIQEQEARNLEPSGDRTLQTEQTELFSSLVFFDRLDL